VGGFNAIKMTSGPCQNYLSDLSSNWKLLANASAQTGSRQRYYLLINENLMVFSCNKMEPHLVALTGFDHLNATASNKSIMQVNLFFLIK
jgi:hypothetical protein